MVPVAAWPGLVPAQLARAGQVWVSADSVSMVYEALTAGAAVGMLEVPRKRSSRISRGLDKLAGAGWVLRFRRLATSAMPQAASQAFNEAERCARWIVERWFA
ncbi:MAG: ELM1/GtrOC1 family putative glycosyltransferase [Candidatus Competibacteraceae bacterium]